MPVSHKVELKKGLRDVYFDRTKSAFIDGREGKLLYRGYNIHDLAEKSTFEETSFLLLKGRLPTALELGDFESQLKSHRRLPDGIADLIRSYKSAHPMDVLRTVISAMSMFDSEATDLSPEAVLQKGIKVIAVTPTVIAAHARVRQGCSIVEPDDDLGHAANFLYMFFDCKPEIEVARLADKDFILHAEHGVNASTFAARVAASTRADYYAAITAGLAVLKGPLHGGAAEGVGRMAIEIGKPENAESYVSGLRARGERVMGIGHAVYRSVDPRAVHLKVGAEELANRKGERGWFSILESVAKVMEPYAKKGYHPNVDFWAGAIYHLIGIPEDMFIPVFAIGRMPGWTMHVIEQYSRKDLLRPRLSYNGPMDLEYVALGQRH